MTTRVAIVALVFGTSLALGTAAIARQPPAFTRTQLQDQDLSVPGRHGVMSRSEFPPGAESGRHFHPGEELGYLLEGTLELTLDGKPPQVLKAGDPIFIPAGAIHNAKNVGKGPARVLATYFLEKGKPLATPVK